MGGWLARFLLKEGKQVVISGRDQGKLREAAERLGVEAASNQEAVKQSDAVILSVPIDKFEQIVREIAPYTSPQQLIFDITSIKARPVEIMHKYINKGTVLGMHPMFGPGAEGIAGQRFVLTPTGKAEDETAGRVRKYLEGKGARVEVMSPAEHDEIMAIVLGLSHFIALVSADTLAGAGQAQGGSRGQRHDLPDAFNHGRERCLRGRRVLLVPADEPAGPGEYREALCREGRQVARPG